MNKYVFVFILFGLSVIVFRCLNLCGFPRFFKNSKMIFGKPQNWQKINFSFDFTKFGGFRRSFVSFQNRGKQTN